MTDDVERNRILDARLAESLKQADLPPLRIDVYRQVAARLRQRRKRRLTRMIAGPLLILLVVGLNWNMFDDQAAARKDRSPSSVEVQPADFVLSDAELADIFAQPPVEMLSDLNHSSGRVLRSLVTKEFEQ